MKRFIIALALFGTALAANAALLMRQDEQGEPLSGDVQAELGGQRLAVPRALIRNRAQLAGGRLDRLDLAVAVEDFRPLPQPSARDPDRPMPERLSIIVNAAAPGSPAPAEAFQTIYARFLARETWSNPGGLVMRRFRQGSPYEDRELYIGAGGRGSFVALCPIDGLREIEPCTARFRQEELDVELRFNARHLPEWRRFLAASMGLVADMTGRRQRSP